ncbi:hypothetical protein FDP41_000780 [Naegleria fowleri]|uniref:Coenzyme Q-binding protein COQ10 START domain-containing protein n=1 Tax=Naegleria fowleri TaxID=5763 RepID=A0A6A5CC68_NAEFO|nr:uncharacterized protein FDP41_000780 [Naegleria fowleri]KAF0984881.1 hypothetical protein FDP41_000780 [Naegleria fowleri]
MSLIFIVSNTLLNNNNNHQETSFKSHLLPEIQDHVHRSSHPLLAKRNEIKKRDEKAAALVTTRRWNCSKPTTLSTSISKDIPLSIIDDPETTKSLPACGQQQVKANHPNAKLEQDMSNAAEHVIHGQEEKEEDQQQELLIYPTNLLDSDTHNCSSCPFESKKQESISLIEELNQAMLQFPTHHDSSNHSFSQHKHCVAFSSQSCLIENTNLKDCLEMLTDFDKYPQRVEGIHSSNTLKKNESKNHEMIVHLKSTILFSTLEYDIKVHVTRDGISFSHLKESSPFKSLQGGWKLEPLENTTDFKMTTNSKQCQTIRATYFIHIEMEPQVLFKGSDHLRPLVTECQETVNSASLGEWISKKSVPSLLQVMKRQIEEYSTQKRVKAFHNQQKQFSQQSSMLFL